MALNEKTGAHDARYIARIIIALGALIYALSLFMSIRTLFDNEADLLPQAQLICDNSADAVDVRLINTTHTLSTIAITATGAGAQSYEGYIDALRDCDFGYDSMGVISREGTLYSVDHAPYHIDSPDEYISQLISGENTPSGSVSTEYSYPEGNRVIMCAIDLPDSAPVTGVIYGLMEPDRFGEAVLDDYLFRDYITVLDAQGDALFCTVPMNELLLAGDETLDAAICGVFGGSEQLITWNDYILVSSRLSYNDWRLVRMIPRAEIDVSDNRPTVIFSLILQTALFVFMCVKLQGVSRKYTISSDELRRSGIDTATGISNYTGFVADARKLIDANPPQRYALIYMCSDQHTTYALAHSTGDSHLLQEDIARMLRSECDIGELCAHINASSFMLLLRYSNTADAMFRIKDINTHLLNSSGQRLQFHYGIYIINEKTLEVEEMTQRALRAAQRVMRHGDLAGVFDTELYQRGLREEDMLRSASGALAAGEFEVRYRPVRDINTKQTVAAEAVAVWHRPDGSELLSRDYMPLFIQNGIMGPIFMFILEHAMQEMSALKAAGHRPGRVIFRIAPDSVFDGTFIPQIERLLRKYQIDPSTLEVIFDEELIQAEPRLAINVVRQLSADGFKVCLNLYSGSTTSMYMFDNVRFDTMRLSRTFIDYIFSTDNAEKAIGGIANMVRSLGSNVLAEGDIHHDMRTVLRACGINICQNLTPDTAPGDNFCRLDEVTTPYQE